MSKSQNDYLLFWHAYFQYKEWHIVYLIERYSKWQVFSSQTSTQ